MMFKIFRDRKYKSISLHLILWGGLLLLSYFLFDMPGNDFDFRFSMFNWVIYILLFYLNYLLFVPRFLFRKKYLIYSVLIFSTFNISIFIKKELDDSFFQKRMAKGLFIDKNFERRPPPEMREFMQLKPGENPPVRPWFIRKNPFYIPAIMQLLLIIMASLILRFLKKWQDDEKLKTEIDRENIATELSFLKQQINPHFLFNAINSIYSLSISQKPETSDAIIKLSSILRYMLYETDKKYVALNDEIQVINNYIELQKLRLTEKVKLKFVIEGNLSGYKIVPLIMVPLIENAFKHGVDNANESFINILIKVDSGNLDLTISNRIVNKSQNNENSGIGIKNIIRRLELLYPDSYIFESKSEDDIFQVNLKIKLEK